MYHSGRHRGSGSGLVALKDGYIESLCAILEQTKHQKPTVSELRSLMEG